MEASWREIMDTGVKVKVTTLVLLLYTLIQFSSL